MMVMMMIMIKLGILLMINDDGETIFTSFNKRYQQLKISLGINCEMIMNHNCDWLND